MSYTVVCTIRSKAGHRLLSNWVHLDGFSRFSSWGDNFKQGYWFFSFFGSERTSINFIKGMPVNFFHSWLEIVEIGETTSWWEFHCIQSHTLLKTIRWNFIENIFIKSTIVSQVITYIAFTTDATIVLRISIFCTECPFLSWPRFLISAPPRCIGGTCVPTPPILPIPPAWCIGAH